MIHFLNIFSRELEPGIRVITISQYSSDLEQNEFINNIPVSNMSSSIFPDIAFIWADYNKTTMTLYHDVRVLISNVATASTTRKEN